MYPCGNCRAAAVGPDGRCAACGTYQQQLQQAASPAGAYPAAPPVAYPAAPPMGMPVGGVDLRRGLSTALIVMLGVSIGLLVLALIARGGQYGQYSDFLDGHMPTREEMEDADDFYAVMWFLSTLSMAAVAVLWAIWFRRLRLNAEVFAPGQHRFSSGWAAGSWFTPVVNFWFPKQIANDIWRASSPQGPQHVSRGLLNAWWVTWIVSGVLFVGSAGSYAGTKDDAEDKGIFVTKGDIEDVQTALGAHLLAYVVTIVAAILALLVVRQITAMQTQRAALPPQPGPAPYGMPGYPGQPAPYGQPAPGQPGPYPPYGSGPTGY